jgi:hypothetical protein
VKPREVRKREAWYVTAGELGVVAIVLPLAGIWDWLNLNSAGVTALAAVAAVVVTAIYAFFTILLWRATQEQATLTRSAIDVQVRPFLVALPLRRGTETLDSFFVHNIGNGAALNSWLKTS